MPVAALVTVGTLDYRKDGYEIDVGNGAVCLINPMSIYSIEIRNELAYVVGYEGFRIIDVSDPSRTFCSASLRPFSRIRAS